MRGLLLGLILAGPATDALADPADWTLPPYQTDIGQAELDVDALAGGAAFGASGHGGQTESGVVKLMPRLHRDYDSGLSLGLDATVTAADPLSFGRYGGDVFEKAYGDVRTGLGRLEVGQTDGAAYDLSVTGPKVDTEVSLDNPQTSFFRDPATRRAFAGALALSTEIGASLNYAKFAYVSPALFGVQVALSFTPAQGKDVLPFLREGPQVPGRQADIWEAALKYARDVGPVTLTGYAGLAEGRGEHKLPGQEGVSELGAGLRADYPLSDDITLSAGGAWRQGNAHDFDITQSWQAGTARAWQASTELSDGAFLLGFEYGSGDSDAVAALPHLGLVGYQASAGYVLSDSIQITGGWQRIAEDRSMGTFYNGAPRIRLDAVFLHLSLKTSGP